MKRANYFFLVAALVLVPGVICARDSAGPEGVIVDTILVKVFTQDGVELVTQSCLDRAPLDGRPRTLDDLIFEILIYRDAVLRFKIVIEEKVVDDYIDSFKQANRLTDEQVKQMFTEAGYTYSEGREQFRIMHTVAQMIDFRVRSRVIIPEREIIAYLQEQPEFIPTTYVIERAFVPVTDDDREQMRKQIDAFVRTGQGVADLVWEAFPTLTVDELSADKRHLTQLAVRQVADPVAHADGFELFRLAEKTEGRERTLEERHNEVMAILRQPKYEELMTAYKKELYDAATIVYS